MKTGREVDCIGLAKSYGIRIKYRDLPLTLGGFLFTGPKWSVMVVNSLHNLDEQRITVAHELVHYLNGDSRTERIRFRSDAENLHEHEIERLGIAFLTPIIAMQREWSATPYVQTLAEIFCIPETSMMARIAEMTALGLLT